MGARVGVDTGRLRADADVLSQAKAEHRCRKPGGEGVGSSRSEGVSEQFEQYWHSGVSTLTDTVDALVESLRSLADAYERRDAKSAEGFQGSARAV